MKTVGGLALLLSLLMTPFAYGDSAPCSSLFLSALGDYLKAANDVDAEALFASGKHAAEIYLKCPDDKEKLKMEMDLGASVRGHPELKKRWLPLGQAFVEVADELIAARKASMRRVQLAGAGLAAAIGIVAGAGAIALKYLPNTPSAVLTAIGTGGIAGAGLGYFILGPIGGHFLLPRDPIASTARDFLTRYPHGEDFLEATSSTDLILGENDLNKP